MKETLTITPSSSATVIINLQDYAGGVTRADFYAYMPQHNYIFVPTRESWPATSVNARLPPVSIIDADGKPDEIKASEWLDKHRPIEQLTWTPGEPLLIQDRLISDGGWFRHDGVHCFNTYRSPTIKHGDAAKAERWVQHVQKVYPGDAHHIIPWLAQRVQRPDIKVNHALVLGGAPGIGKDTLLEPVKQAIGPWNFQEVLPKQMLGRFNSYLKSVILRVSEARDLGEFDRFSFYDHSKTIIAAPPDVFRVDEKNLREHAVLNVCGVVITTNHKTDGIFLPSDDRRHFVAWSDLTKDDFTPDYWNVLYDWYAKGGYGHVAAYLRTLDITAFNPKAPPPKTAAFFAIVDANRAPEDAELEDALDYMGRPDAVTRNSIMRGANQSDIVDWLGDRKNRRVLPHRLERCGYVPVRNDAAKDGLWKVNSKRQVIYARDDLSISDQIKAATRISAGEVI